VTERRALPLVVLPLAALALGAAALAGAATSQGTDADAFERGASVMAALALAALALAARPAWPLSLGLAAAVFSGHWSDLGSPVAFDRVLLLSGIVSAVVREWRAGGAALRTRPIHWLLALVAAYAVISAAVAGTLSESGSRFVLLDRFSLVGFALFFVAPMAFREARDRRILLGVLVALGAYLGLTALIETTGPRGLLLPRYIDDPTVGIHFDRARGPFAEAVGNGLVLYACGVASIIAALKWRTPSLRWLAGAVAALCVLGTLLTLTRAVWLGVIAGTIVALLYARETRRFAVPAVVLGVAGVLLAFAAIPDLQARADKRQNDQRPLWDRKNSDRAALRMIDARPVLGFGWGRFRAESADYYRQSPDYPLTRVRDVHNVYLANAVELGLLGAGMWIAALLVAIGTALTRRGPPDLRPWRVGLVAVAVSYAVAAATTPLSFTLPTLLLWTWAGLCWITGKEEARTPLRPARPGSTPAPAAGPS
jgi:putative inorganic carbon (HCO3(-)) transporter